VFGANRILRLPPSFDHHPKGFTDCLLIHEIVGLWPALTALMATIKIALRSSQPSSIEPSGTRPQPQTNNHQKQIAHCCLSFEKKRDRSATPALPARENRSQAEEPISFYRITAA
jgi:hypothetical protein